MGHWQTGCPLKSQKANPPILAFWLFRSGFLAFWLFRFGFLAVWLFRDIPPKKPASIIEISLVKNGFLGGVPKSQKASPQKPKCEKPKCQKAKAEKPKSQPPKKPIAKKPPSIQYNSTHRKSDI